MGQGDDAGLHTLTFTPKTPPDLITDPQAQGLDPTGPTTKPDLWRVTYEGRVKFTEGRWYPPAEANVATDNLHAIYAANTTSADGTFSATPLWTQRYNGDIYYAPSAGGALVRVLTKQITGWAAMTGTATRTGFATYVPPAPTPASSTPPTSTPASYSAAQIGALMTQVQELSERLKALTDDLGATPAMTSQGLIGP